MLKRRKRAVADGIVFTCRHILDEDKPVLHIGRDRDGDWQLLCGAVHTTGEGRVISFAEAAEIEPDIRGLVGLERGYSAERTGKNEEWKIKRGD